VAGRRGAGQAVKELPTVVQALAPVLLAQPGVGPVTSAQLLTSWSHPTRRRSQAAVAMFAVLAGVAPIPACCGQVVRDRRNGGGDRPLHRAVHAVVVVHQACHELDQPPATWPAAAPRPTAPVGSTAGLCVRSPAGPSRLLERQVAASAA
jgi:hypothetical protein